MARKLFPIMFVLWLASIVLVAVTGGFAVVKVVDGMIDETNRTKRQMAAVRQCVMDAIATLPAAYPLDKIKYHCHQQARNTP
ncbi:hypothetical protein [Stappia indica]|uniref:hypothetical protein n=1 Tax=Stappia indica TaxID=538381 RepID=UPI001D1865CD|nr:hypothetical protein [Stappia indica]MCC4243391.1 hypothetical protein [Stappia indica]